MVGEEAGVPASGIHVDLRSRITTMVRGLAPLLENEDLHPLKVKMVQFKKK